MRRSGGEAWGGGGEDMREADVLISESASIH